MVLFLLVWIPLISSQEKYTGTLGTVVEWRALDCWVATLVNPFTAPPTPPTRATVLLLNPPSLTLVSGASCTVTATLTDEGGSPLAGRIIRWSVFPVYGGVEAGTLSSAETVTDSMGQAAVTYTAPIVASTQRVEITAQFVGGDGYGGSSSTATCVVSPAPIPTSLLLTPQTATVRPGESIILAVRLLDGDGNPVADRPVVWAAEAGLLSADKGITDSSGQATVVFTSSSPGIFRVTASFRGDSIYLPSEASSYLSVLPEEKEEELVRVRENLTQTAGQLVIPLENENLRLLEGSLLQGKLGAVLTVTVKAGVPETVKSYEHAEVRVGIPKVVQGKEIRVVVESESREGRTVVINMDNTVFPLAQVSRLKVLVDGEEASLAEDYSDVLDPTNDGERAEYLVLIGERGIQVLVSLPHFSTRTITIRGPIAAPSVWTPALVAVSIVIVVLILLFSFRRKPAARVPVE